jgi:putative Mg2+ transporter-C (MgtC) family protein
VPLELEMVLRILLSAVLGMVVGFERFHAHKPAGLRTHMLVCIGSALFTVASIYGFGATSDPSRIAAGVVAGVGFLGAGAIIHAQDGGLHGLTTASSIWAVAAIGLAAGAGMYIVAPVATGIVLVVLYVMKRVEKK